MVFESNFKYFYQKKSHAAFFNVFSFFYLLMNGQRLRMLASPTSAPVKSIVSALSFLKSSTIPLNFYGNSTFFFFFWSTLIWEVWENGPSFTISLSSKSLGINLDWSDDCPELKLAAGLISDIDKNGMFYTSIY